MKNSSKKEIRHVTFDEDVIAEHDKERGTRMQIPEPDTPFLRSSIMSSDDESGSPTFNLDNNPSVCRPLRIRHSNIGTSRQSSKRR
jgi:hypothetical protein